MPSIDRSLKKWQDMLPPWKHIANGKWAQNIWPSFWTFDAPPKKRNQCRLYRDQPHQPLLWKIHDILGIIFPTIYYVPSGIANRYITAGGLSLHIINILISGIALVRIAVLFDLKTDQKLMSSSPSNVQSDTKGYKK